VILVGTALLVLGADMLGWREGPERGRHLKGACLGGAGCVVALLWIVTHGESGDPAAGMLVVDSLTRWVKGALLVLTALTLWVSAEETFTRHVGEYHALVLLAATGMLFLAGSENLLMIFVSLELISLSLYILTAFNKRDAQSAEAGLKYFLFGGMSAAFTLFGLSLVYGVSGETNLREIAAALRGEGMDPLLAVGLVMTVMGLGFKVAAVPFHLWAPDVYQGAPLPSAALIASGSKVASFFILAKVMEFGFAGAEGSGVWGGFVTGWMPLLAVVATLSMVLGNLAALTQTSVRRLLAYSAVAHAGYMLLGVIAGEERGIASLMYYSVTYGLATIGAFAVVGVVQGRTGSDAMGAFAGLGRRSPVLAGCLLVFLLSLAGIPPLAGFFGKFYLFAAVAGSESGGLGLIWLVVVAVGMSAVSLYYYLQWLKQAYVVAVPEMETRGVPDARVSTVAVAVLLAAGVVLTGCVPDLVLGGLEAAIRSAGW
jgi:NADH-quinone oxidoreductase subunit N